MVSVEFYDTINGAALQLSLGKHMKKPLIGLNCSLNGIHNDPPAGEVVAPLAYAESIQRAGGRPVILPPLHPWRDHEALMKELDGICFIGGADYDPHHYKGRVQRAEELMDPRRDRFDWALGKWALQQKRLPILGICGGHQLLCIAAGGALVQDIAKDWMPLGISNSLPHASGQRAGAEKRGYRHSVRVHPESLLAKCMGVKRKGDGTVVTNSHHHQAVQPGREGQGFCASAWADDGVIEALEPAEGSSCAKAKRFILGVQWHPERMPDAADQRSIFKAFVNAAGRA